MEPEGTHDVTLGAHRRPVCSAAHVLSLSRVPWHPRGFAPDGEQRTDPGRKAIRVMDHVPCVEPDPAAGGPRPPTPATRRPHQCAARPLNPAQAPGLPPPPPCQSPCPACRRASPQARRASGQRHRLSSSSSSQPARHRRHQRCEPRHPLQRLEHDLRRAIAVRRLERLADLPRSRQRQTLAGDGLGRNRLCRDVSRRNMQVGSRRTEMPARELTARGNREAPHHEKGPGVASRASFIER
jgi:hypothetical protein